MNLIISVHYDDIKPVLSNINSIVQKIYVSTNKKEFRGVLQEFIEGVDKILGLKVKCSSPIEDVIAVDFINLRAFESSLIFTSNSHTISECAVENNITDYEEKYNSGIKDCIKSLGLKLEIDSSWLVLEPDEDGDTGVLMGNTVSFDEQLEDNYFSFVKNFLRDNLTTNDDTVLW